MTRPLARSSCHHCGFRICRREGVWWHEATRDRGCVDRGAPTGDLAHPAGTACPEGCADRLRIIDFAEHQQRGMGAEDYCTCDEPYPCPTRRNAGQVRDE